MIISQTSVTGVDCARLGVKSLLQQQQKLFSTPRLARDHLLNEIIGHLKAEPSKHLPAGTTYTGKLVSRCRHDTIRYDRRV